MFVPKKLGYTLMLGSLLAACSSAPQKPTTIDASAAATSSAESNEPDLEKIAKERAAQGLVKAKEAPKEKQTSSIDTSPEIVLPEASAELKALAAPVLADYQKAIVLMKAQQLNDAYALFDDIQGKTPMFSGPVLNQAMIRIRQQNYKEAELLLKRAIGINEKNPFTYNLQGLVYRQQGRFADSRAAYEKALTISPNYAKAHFNLAVLADLYLQDLPFALQHYEAYQALQTTPDTTAAKWIVDLQKRTGVYKPPVKPAPVEDVTVEETPVAVPADGAATPNADAANASPAPTTPTPEVTKDAVATDNAAPVIKEDKKASKKSAKAKKQAKKDAAAVASPAPESAKPSSADTGTASPASVESTVATPAAAPVEASKEAVAAPSTTTETAVTPSTTVDNTHSDTAKTVTPPAAIDSNNSTPAANDGKKPSKKSSKMKKQAKNVTPDTATPATEAVKSTTSDNTQPSTPEPAPTTAAGVQP